MTSLIFKLHNCRKFAVITFFDLTAKQKVYENIRDEGSSFKAFLVISAENVLAIIEMDCAQGFPLFFTALPSKLQKCIYRASDSTPKGPSLPLSRMMESASAKPNEARKCRQ